MIIDLQSFLYTFIQVCLEKPFLMGMIAPPVFDAMLLERDGAGDGGVGRFTSKPPGTVQYSLQVQDLPKSFDLHQFIYVEQSSP